MTAPTYGLDRCQPAGRPDTAGQAPVLAGLDLTCGSREPLPRDRPSVGSNRLVHILGLGLGTVIEHTFYYYTAT
jgi:hypothetical protein